MYDVIGFFVCMLCLSLFAIGCITYLLICMIRRRDDDISELRSDIFKLQNRLFKHDKLTGYCIDECCRLNRMVNLINSKSSGDDE